MAETKARDKAEIKEKADQYKVLFDFYKAEYEALRNEFYKVEDKAAKYLTSLSVLSGILLVEPYRVCRRVNILRDYPDDKIKIYP